MSQSPRSSPATAFEVLCCEGGMQLQGDLVLSSATAALSRLLSKMPAGSGSVAVDLTGLGASDSAGLAVLVEWRAEAAQRGVLLRLCHPPAGLRALARLSDLDAELFA